MRLHFTRALAAAALGGGWLLLPLMLLLPLLWASTPAQAQPLTVQFERLTVEDGLPDNSVVDLLQDRLGFLWFATRNGLARYDGYEVVVYKPDPEDPQSLGHRDLTAVAEGSDGSLWIGTRYGGLYHLDRATGRFTPHRHDPADPASLSDDHILSLHVGRGGLLWVGTGGGGLNRFDPATGRFTHYRHDYADAESLGDDEVRSVFEDRDGAVWVGTGAGGLYRLDPATKRFSAYRHRPGEEASLLSNTVNVLYEDRQGVLWVGTGRRAGQGRGGIGWLDRATGQFTPTIIIPPDPKTLGDEQAAALYEDRDGRLWAGFEGEGLFLVDRASGRQNHYLRDNNDPSSLSGNQVLAILQDDAGVLWFCSGTQGVNKWDPARAPFTHYAHQPYNPNSLSANTVRSLAEDLEGGIWVGTQGGGLNRFDPATGRFTHYRHDPDDPSSLPSGRVVALHGGRDGTLWVGTNPGGLSRFDAATGRFRRYQNDPADPYSVTANGVQGLVEDADGALWVGLSGKGLSRLDPATGRFTHYRHDPDDPHSLVDDRIRTLYVDRAGTLWVGTVQGLSRYDRLADRFTNYRDPERGLTFVTTMYEDAEGRFWVGDRFGGLHRLDRDNDAARWETIAQRLHRDPVFSLVGDGQGYLWIGTAAGLERLDPASGAVRSYDQVDGLGGSLFQRNAALRSRDGRLYFGGQHGLDAFDPRSLAENPVPPRVVLTQIRLANQPLRPAPEGVLRALPEMTDRLVLNHDQNYLGFTYAGLHFSRPQKTQYAYRMEPLDDAWLPVGTQRTATFANLEPGTYVFRVRAANSDGVWSEDALALSITIRAPWWATMGFRLSMLLLLAGLIYGGYRVQVARIKARNRQLETEVAERTTEVRAQAGQLRELNRIKSRFFANISHEFRTPLTLTIGPLEDLQHETAGRLTPRETRKVGLALRNARRLLRLINQLLDVTRLEAGRMELHPVPGDAVASLADLVRSFASLAERRHVTLSFEAEVARLPARFDPDMLDKVVSNLLSNAFKFTKAGGRIHVSVGLDRTGEGGHMVITVRDSGAGIAPDALAHIFDRFYQVDGSSTRLQEGTGIGLSLVKEMVELHGGQVEAESRPGFGSTFRIRMARGEVDPRERSEEGVPSAPSFSIAGQAAPQEPTPVLTENGASEEKASEDKTSEEKASGEETSDRTTVLVVDDNAEIRAYIRDHLGDVYAIREAVDGQDGLEQAREHLPDLILSDVMMPRLDGFGLCQAIKSDPALDCIPVILLTARAEHADAIEGLERGADDYLIKPFDVRELHLRVDNQIASGQRLRERLRAQFRAEAPTPAKVVLADPDVPSMEEALLEQAQAAVLAHLDDANFGVEALASALGMSRAHLHRKLRAVTGTTPSAFIRTLRLERAGQLLAARAGTVTEVAYAVGFSSLSHFSKTFRAHFGVLPSAYPAV